MKQALADADPDVRTAAAVALSPAPDLVSIATSPLDPVRLGLAAGNGAASAKALEAAGSRSALLPLLLRTGQESLLSDLAAKKGDAQLDAISALGRLATEDAIAVLTKLSAKDGGGDETVRKAAFRAVRRAHRVHDKEKETAS